MLSPDNISSLEIIAESIEICRNRYAEVVQSDSLTSYDKTAMILDSIAMRLLLIGEKVKTIEQKTPGFLFQNGIDARPIIRTRDFLSHHYENVDFDAIKLICEKHLPDLEEKIKAILAKG